MPYSPSVQQQQAWHFMKYRVYYRCTTPTSKEKNAIHTTRAYAQTFVEVTCELQTSRTALAVPTSFQEPTFPASKKGLLVWFLHSDLWQAAGRTIWPLQNSFASPPLANTNNNCLVIFLSSSSHSQSFLHLIKSLINSSSLLGPLAV